MRRRLLAYFLAQTDRKPLVKGRTTLLLFRRTKGYFRKYGCAVTSRTDSKSPHAELVLALQSARTRLAVAAAAGRRSTPPAATERYLKTAEHVGRVVRKWQGFVRNGAISTCGQARALESLGALTTCDDPAQMERILGDIVAELERCIAFPERLPL